MTLRQLLFGKHPSLQHGVAVRISTWQGWLLRWPTWLISLFYTLRVFVAAGVVFGLPIVVGQYAGPGWSKLTFGTLLALIAWGYIHQVIKSQQRLRP